MKLSEWAKIQGITYRTAFSWFKAGKIKDKVTQTETGTILVFPEQLNNSEEYILYARVSSHDQKEDLNNQLNRLRDYAASKGIKVSKEIKEIGSGLNGKRKLLLSALKETNYNLIVEHKDRLARFGVEMVEACFQQSNRKLIIINNSDLKEDLVQDFIDLATSMCAKIYGKRSAKNRALKAINAAKLENENIKIN